MKEKYRMGIKVLGWEVKARGTVRELLWNRTLPSVLFFSLFGLLYIAADRTAFFANYRYGDAIIPTQSQLVKTGPFIPEIIQASRKDGINFISLTSQQNSTDYFEKWEYFDDYSDSKSLIKLRGSDARAYLYLYPDNPIKQVWGVQINGLDVQSFERAIQTYKAETDLTPLIYLEAAISLLFCFSVFQFQRISTQE